MTADLTTLPTPVRAYLEAATPDAVAAVFAEDATVTDEGHTYRGRAAIRAWRAETESAWTFTTQVTGIRRDGDVWVVATHLRGDFPGGEADLDQRFTVRRDTITDLTHA